MTWRCTTHQHAHFHVMMAVQIDAERSFACFDRTSTHPIRGERAGRAAAHEQLPDATSGGQPRRTKASATAKDTPKQATQTHKHTHKPAQPHQRLSAHAGAGRPRGVTATPSVGQLVQKRAKRPARQPRDSQTYRPPTKHSKKLARHRQ